MSIICPTITAYDPDQYASEMGRVAAFAERVHIDLMDGQFAPSRSPDLGHVWWPPQLRADLHLMYRQPAESLEAVIKLQPHLAVIHYEALTDHARLAAELRNNGIKAGLALLQATSVENVLELLGGFDHALIFSGHLGFHGGETDLGLLDKVAAIKSHYPNMEIAWDGGVNAKNAPQLAAGGVNVLNAGGFIQDAADPQQAFQQLQSAVSGGSHG